MAHKPRTPRGMRDRREQISMKANKFAAQAMTLPWLDWYVLQTAPQADWRVQSALHAMEVPVFLAWRGDYRRPSRYTRQRKILRRNIMPRMLFIGFQSGQERFLEVLGLEGALNVVGHSGAPAALLGDDLTKFLQRIGAEVDAPEWMRDQEPHALYRVGDRVRIIDGVLSGQVVEVTELRGAKVRVLAEVMRQAQSVEIGLDRLERMA